MKLPADPAKASEALRQVLAKFEEHVQQKFSTITETQGSSVTRTTVTKIVNEATGNSFDKSTDTLDDIQEGTINIFFTPDMLTLLKAKSTMPHGSVMLDANGTADVESEDIEANSMVLLDPPAGTSGAKISYSNITPETSFTITSAGGTDDAGLLVKWALVRESAVEMNLDDSKLAALEAEIAACTINKGTTAQRNALGATLTPTSPVIGFLDTDEGRPYWWSGTEWV